MKKVILFVSTIILIFGYGFVYAQDGDGILERIANTLDRIEQALTNQPLGWSGDRESVPQILIDGRIDGNATSSNGTGIDVKAYRNVEIEISATGSPTHTTKFYGSIASTSPDFDESTSTHVHYDTILLNDLEDGAKYDGDTGISFSGTNETRLFQANIDGLSWFYATNTSFSSGSTTISVQLFNNQ